ncbi:calcium-binding protein [Azovibrio restrictus]|uniref:calcium-binding protein n=1 Tax=Azovibrio restrictus TaxID=146938 RepID=UPI0026EB1942|nr:calcium-binding protein [Azovibrio restrictus]MDD3484003.1 calcium-binding protein [Azovibrio restrictus]
MLISAKDYLGQFGISMGDALAFVAGNIGQPQVIHQVFKSAGLTTRMLTEIVQQAIPEVTHDVVKAYLSGSGLDYVELDLPDFAAIKASSAIAHLSTVNDNVIGTEGDDYIDAGAGDDVIDALGGADFLYGDSGNDIIYGKAGADYLEGGGGNDELYGFHPYLSGDDRAPNVLFGNAGADKLYGGQGDDHLYGGDGADRLYDDYPGGLELGTFGNDWLDGGNGDDQLHAGSGFDTLLGGEGNDYIGAGGVYGFNIVDGGAGNDSILFTQGDQVYGGSGDDQISYQAATSQVRLQYDPASAGHSVVVGGEGADSFYFGGLSSLLATSKVTLDLRETVSCVDKITGIDLHSKPVSPVLEVLGFAVGTDKIDIDDFDLYGSNSADNKVGSTWGYNFAQILTSPQQDYRLPLSSGSKTADDYGKGFFVIQGAASAADVFSVAKLLDAYGNDATYGKSDSHYFLVNVGEKDSALYLFTDDTGADNQIIADELTPLVLLSGVRTEDFSAADLAYTFI